VKLTTHLHLVPKLRMLGAIPPPQYVFMVLCLMKRYVMTWCLVKHRTLLYTTFLPTSWYRKPGYVRISNSTIQILGAGYWLDV